MHTDRHTDRQHTDRQTDGQTDRQTERDNYCIYDGKDFMDGKIHWVRMTVQESMPFTQGSGVYATMLAWSMSVLKIKKYEEIVVWVLMCVCDGPV